MRSRRAGDHRAAGLLYGPGSTPPLAAPRRAVGPLRIILAGRDYLLPLAYVDNVADAIALACAATRARAAPTPSSTCTPAGRLSRACIASQRGDWTPVYAPLGLLRAGGELPPSSASACSAGARRSPAIRSSAPFAARPSAAAGARRARWQPRVRCPRRCAEGFTADTHGGDRAGAPGATRRHEDTTARRGVRRCGG
jgi:hypothetical protein